MPEARAILAIDPGPTESGWCILDVKSYRPLLFGKDENAQLLSSLLDNRFFGPFGPFEVREIVIEMVEGRNVTVGADVFDTCVWVGRFFQASLEWTDDVFLVKRRLVKRHFDVRKDAEMVRALVKRFSGQEGGQYGKGTKATPGFFYGFKADVWQSFALGAYWIDTEWQGR